MSCTNKLKEFRRYYVPTLIYSLNSLIKGGCKYVTDETKKFITISFYPPGQLNITSLERMLLIIRQREGRSAAIGAA